MVSPINFWAAVTQETVCGAICAAAVADKRSRDCLSTLVTWFFAPYNDQFHKLLAQSVSRLLGFQF